MIKNFLQRKAALQRIDKLYGLIKKANDLAEKATDSGYELDFCVWTSGGTSCSVELDKFSRNEAESRYKKTISARTLRATCKRITRELEELRETDLKIDISPQRPNGSKLLFVDGISLSGILLTVIEDLIGKSESLLKEIGLP